MARYWKHRKEALGDRAFLPLVDLSGNCGLTTEDVQLLQTGYCVNLPRDQSGRSVIYVDVSKRTPGKQTSKRVVFFVLQCVMENELSRSDEFVILVNMSNPFSGNFQMLNLEFAKLLLDQCMPIQDFRLHLIYSPTTQFDQSFIDDRE